VRRVFAANGAERRAATDDRGSSAGLAHIERPDTGRCHAAVTRSDGYYATGAGTAGAKCAAIADARGGRNEQIASGANRGIGVLRSSAIVAVDTNECGAIVRLGQDQCGGQPGAVSSQAHTRSVVGTTAEREFVDLWHTDRCFRHEDRLEVAR